MYLEDNHFCLAISDLKLAPLNPFFEVPDRDVADGGLRAVASLPQKTGVGVQEGSQYPSRMTFGVSLFPMIFAV